MAENAEWQRACLSRRSMPTKLTPYKEHLKQALIADSYRPKRDRRTALKLLEEMPCPHASGLTLQEVL